MSYVFFMCVNVCVCRLHVCPSAFKKKKLNVCVSQQWQLSGCTTQLWSSTSAAKQTGKGGTSRRLTQKMPSGIFRSKARITRRVWRWNRYSSLCLLYWHKGQTLAQLCGCGWNSYSVYLLYWYKVQTLSQLCGCGWNGTRTQCGSIVLSLLALLVQKYNY